MLKKLIFEQIRQKPNMQRIEKLSLLSKSRVWTVLYRLSVSFDITTFANAVDEDQPASEKVN